MGTVKSPTKFTLQFHPQGYWRFYRGYVIRVVRRRYYGCYSVQLGCIHREMMNSSFHRYLFANQFPIIFYRQYVGCRNAYNEVNL